MYIWSLCQHAEVRHSPSSLLLVFGVCVCVCVCVIGLQLLIISMIKHLIWKRAKVMFLK